MTADVKPTPPRSAIVGGGFMATVHSRAIRAAGGTVVGVASSSRARAERAAGALGLGVAFDSVADLLGHDDIDVVHICTPNTTHAGYARAALDAGKHVICEKPLAVDVADATLLVEQAASAGKVAAVPFVYRFHPLVREARARIARGDAGRLLSVQGSYLQDWLLGIDDTDWRVDPALGGPSRAFADIGSHLTDLIEFATSDRIARLCAVVSRAYPTRAGAAVATEDAVALAFELTGGAIGTVLVSQVAAGRKNALVIEIGGSDESVRFEQENPETLWLGRRTGSTLLPRDPAQASPDSARLSVLPAGHPLGYQDAFTAFVADTYAAIGGAKPEGLPTFADGLRAAQVTEAVLRSARDGGWVDVPTARTREEGTA
ncbi:MAG: Gfo/Idh/MocA family oxidoreductase [Microbacteriaceae bacterium]